MNKARFVSSQIWFVLLWSPLVGAADLSTYHGFPFPVEKVVFRFYNGQLFRMVVDYDSQKTEGLRAEDLIQAISLRYGTATRPAGEVLLPSAVFSQGVTVLARWGDADYSFNLVHSPYGSSFGLVGFSKRLDGLAQAAIASGIQLDEHEAPQR